MQGIGGSKKSAGGSTASAPKLISRVYVSDSGAGASQVIVPGTAGFAIASAIGSGGAANAYGAAGGGGAYAREYFPVAGNEILLATVGVARDTALKRGTSIIIQAGQGASSTGIGQGGLTSSCVGTVKRPGISGRRDNTTTPPTCNGGDPGNDLNDAQSLGLYGVGAQGGLAGNKDAQGFGSGGARGNVTGDPLMAPHGGLLVVEFYTADPRNITI
jgi:hypothetical protein